MVAENINSREALIRLWRLLGILTITTTVFFTVFTGVTATPADLTFFVTVLFALVTPTAGMLACLHTGRLRLAVYCSIPGVLISASACCFMLFAFFAPLTDLAHILLYPVGIAFALPYGYASVLQLKVAATICVRKRNHHATLDTGADGLLLTP
jgi:hypothetical protein